MGWWGTASCGSELCISADKYNEVVAAYQAAYQCVYGSETTWPIFRVADDPLLASDVTDLRTAAAALVTYAKGEGRTCDCDWSEIATSGYDVDDVCKDSVDVSIGDPACLCDYECIIRLLDCVTNFNGGSCCADEICFTIDAIDHCRCGSVGGVFVGTFPAGTYTVRYEAGAITTQSGIQWNRTYGGTTNSCNPSSWRPYIGSAEGIHVLSGFNTSGWPDAASAEAANVGTSITFSLSSTQDVYAWYSDNVCADNIGEVTYCISEAISSSSSSSSSSSTAAGNAAHAYEAYYEVYGPCFGLPGEWVLDISAQPYDTNVPTYGAPLDTWIVDDLSGGSLRVIYLSNSAVIPADPPSAAPPLSNGLYSSGALSYTAGTAYPEIQYSLELDCTDLNGNSDDWCITSSDTWVESVDVNITPTDTGWDYWPVYYDTYGDGCKWYRVSSLDPSAIDMISVAEVEASCPCPPEYPYYVIEDCLDQCGGYSGSMTAPSSTDDIFWPMPLFPGMQLNTWYISYYDTWSGCFVLFCMVDDTNTLPPSLPADLTTMDIVSLDESVTYEYGAITTLYGIYPQSDTVVILEANYCCDDQSVFDCYVYGTGFLGSTTDGWEDEGFYWGPCSDGCILTNGYTTLFAPAPPQPSVADCPPCSSSSSSSSSSSDSSSSSSSSISSSSSSSSDPTVYVYEVNIDLKTSDGDYLTVSAQMQSQPVIYEVLTVYAGPSGSYPLTLPRDVWLANTDKGVHNFTYTYSDRLCRFRYIYLTNTPIAPAPPPASIVSGAQALTGDNVIAGLSHHSISFSSRNYSSHRFIDWSLYDAQQILPLGVAGGFFTAAETVVPEWYYVNYSTQYDGHSTFKYGDPNGTGGYFVADGSTLDGVSNDRAVLSLAPNWDGTIFPTSRVEYEATSYSHADASRFSARDADSYGDAWDVSSASSHNISYTYTKYSYGYYGFNFYTSAIRSYTRLYRPIGLRWGIEIPELTFSLEDRILIRLNGYETGLNPGLSLPALDFSIAIGDSIGSGGSISGYTSVGTITTPAYSQAAGQTSDPIHHDVYTPHTVVADLTAIAGLDPYAQHLYMSAECITTPESTCFGSLTNTFELDYSMVQVEINAVNQPLI